MPYSPIDIGDVICVRTGNSFVSRMIRLGAAILDKPNTVNHIVIAHHIDKAGVFWGIEGRPGGVGWVDLRRYIDSVWTVGNGAQPKSSHQRHLIALAAKGLVGTPYDWSAIAEDGMNAISATRLFGSKQWGKQTPGHVVCSSLADWVYEEVGLASPQPDQTCTPGDWAEFIITKGWEK